MATTSRKKGRFSSMPFYRKAFVVTMVFVIIMSIISVIINPDTPKNANTPRGAGPKQTNAKPSNQKSGTSRSSPKPPAKPESDTGPTVLNPNGPVAAAKAGMEALEAAQFLPRERAESIVRAVVTPEEVEDQKRTLRFRAPAFARDPLGYTSLSAAEELSNYSYVATMGNLDLLVGGTARVSLFGMMSWLGPPNRQDRQKQRAAYNLRYVFLSRLKNSPGQPPKWKLLGWELAPNQPSTPDGKTLSQAKAKRLFEPLIKDFEQL